MKRVALLLIVACKNGQQPGSEITVSPAASASASASASAADADADAEPSFGAAWLSCRADTDCTVVSLGCCHAHAINRAHEKDGQKMLNESGMHDCPPKSACLVPPVKCVHAICKL